MLIGATIFWESLCVGQIKATSERPVLQKTLFGWILGGSSESTRQKRMPTHCNLITNQQLDASLTRFWEQEQYPKRINFTAEEKLCEQHFVETYRRDHEGRFIVQLPFRKDIVEQLGESKNIALRRFYTLERKLNKNPTLRNTLNFSTNTNDWDTWNWLKSMTHRQQAIIYRIILSSRKQVQLLNCMSFLMHLAKPRLEFRSMIHSW